MKKRLAILGATGSIGTQALQVVDAHPDKFEIEILSAHSNSKLLIEQAIKYQPNAVVVTDSNQYTVVKSALENSKLNKVDKISVLLGDSKVIPKEKFDIVIANINRNILLDQVSDYSNALTNGGVLLISGFYEGEDLEILKTNAESAGFQFLDNKTRDRWVAARFIRQ